MRVDTIARVRRAFHVQDWTIAGDRLLAISNAQGSICDEKRPATGKVRAPDIGQGASLAKQPTKSATQFPGAVRFVPATVGQDNPLGIPFDHLFDGSLEA